MHDVIVAVVPVDGRATINAIISFREKMPGDWRKFLIGPIQQSRSGAHSLNGIFVNFLFVPDKVTVRSLDDHYHGFENSDSWRKRFCELIREQNCDLLRVQFEHGHVSVLEPPTGSTSIDLVERVRQLENENGAVAKQLAEVLETIDHDRILSRALKDLDRLKKYEKVIKAVEMSVREIDTLQTVSATTAKQLQEAWAEAQATPDQLFLPSPTTKNNFEWSGAAPRSDYSYRRNCEPTSTYWKPPQDL